MKDLTVSASPLGGPLRLYTEMQSAIAKCHSVDGCKDVADKAAAVAAYYKQIKDDASMKKFLEIKMRAWRRIGEILNAVDTSDCVSLGARSRKYRATIDVGDMTNAHLKQALDVATLKNAHDAAVREDHKDTRLAAHDLHAAGATGVGITLDRRDRMTMHTTVFLLREPIYEALRQAAFDHRMTMHAILREGLALWFAANGYSVPMSDTDLRLRSKAKSKSAA